MRSIRRSSGRDRSRFGWMSGWYGRLESDAILFGMELTLDLPEELSAVLAVPGQDISRSAFEAIALEAYRERKITTAQLRRLLGFESGYDLDGFLKQHEVWLEYGWEELERDRETH